MNPNWSVGSKTSTSRSLSSLFPLKNELQRESKDFIKPKLVTVIRSGVIGLIFSLFVFFTESVFTGTLIRLSGVSFKHFSLFSPRYHL